MKELVFSLVVKKLDDFLRDLPRKEGSLSKEKRKDLLSIRNSLEQLKLSPQKSEDGGKNDDEVYFKCVRYAYKVEDFIDNLAVDVEKFRRSIRYTGSKFIGKLAVEVENLINYTGSEFMKLSSNFLTDQITDSKVKELIDELRLIQNEKVPVLGEEISRSTVPEEPFPSTVPDRFLIAVVGTGGLGKSYLGIKRVAHQNYDERSSKLYVWVHVSKDYEIPYLLRKVIKTFNKDSALQNELDMMETEELVLYFYESLAERSYEVVLDDVWDSEVWAYLGRVLLYNKLGSRVFITTHIRSSNDKSGVERTKVYDHPGADKLDKDFLQFLKPWQEIPKPMENRLILPEISSILALSFDDLHHPLKLCYLYLGLFPEDFEMKVDKVVRLWVAEGFIKSGKGGTLEEVAMDYVNELVDRSLIQIGKRNATRISTFKVRPCLRALLLKKSKELKLLHDFDYKTKYGWFRRVAFHCGFRKDFTTDDETRTVMVFSKETDILAKPSNVEFFRSLSLLQVLDLEGTWFSASRETGKTTLPDVIGTLVLLRYLGLNDTYIDNLPPSIKTLRYLQTLYVDREILVSIPNEISELKKLRHLFGRLKGPFEVKNLTELQTLGYIEVFHRRKFTIMDLHKLRELYVDLNYRGRSVLVIIGEFATLQSLYLKLPGAVDLQPLSKCRDLLQLKLKGGKGKLPDNMDEIFPNLRYLYICSSNNSWQIELMKLAKLQKLTILDLYRCDISINEFNKDKSFPQLEILQLIKCGLNDLTLSDTTMPLLKELLIITPEGKNISHEFMSLPPPKHWRCPKDDDWRCPKDDEWPFYPRTMP